LLAGKEVAEAPHLLAGQRETCLWGEQLARHTISVIWRREPDADEKVLISLLHGTRCLVPFPYTLRIEPRGAHQRFEPLTSERLARFHKWARKGIKTSKTFGCTTGKTAI
jgi:hypothetical protein